jgi:adenosylcobyric acid synthase
MLARTIMIQGTASSVGKSLLAAAMCRMLRQDGLRVAPFKAQNMALNSCVTPDGGEIGRAQFVQAEAARVAPTVDMNPILLKPEGDARSQVVVHGKPIGVFGARDYHAKKPDLRAKVAESLLRLREQFDVVVIEGAGSPAEINLKDRDLVNMFVARIADAPVLLVGDIDRGGVFAALLGTLELLDADERARVAGLVINKFRGDVELLRPGLDFIAERTGVPVMGVVPYMRALRVADEDSVSLDHRAARPRADASQIEIAVVRLPRISNYNDFEPLEHESGVVVRFVEQASEIDRADLVVVPGTKSTMADLAWLRASGIADAVVARAAQGKPVLGICGGCQMLGGAIEDPYGVESDAPRAEGLGLLPLATRFERAKTTAQVEGIVHRGSFFDAAPMSPVTGYEIHMGTALATAPDAAPFCVQKRNGARVVVGDGAVSADGAVVGTMIHGLFDEGPLRGQVLASLRARRGLAAPVTVEAPFDKHAEYDRIADVLRRSIDRERLAKLLGSRG